MDSPEQRFESDGNASETILRGLIRFEQSPKLTWEFGGEVAYNMLETEQAFSIGGTPVPLPSASVKVEETRGEVFGKGTWRVRDDLTIEGGLRMEASTITQSGDAEQEKSFFFPKPRLLATWTPMPNNQFRLRFEREVGQLDFGDFAASADLEDENVFGGNIDLEPEQRWISELIYERRFLGDGIVSIGLRHDEIVDAIDVIPLDDGLSAVGNIGDGTLDQLAVNVLVPMDWAGFTGGRLGFRNTWNQTEVTDPTTGEARPISNVPQHAGDLHYRPGHHVVETAVGRRLDPAAGSDQLRSGPALQLARAGLFRGLGRVQADPDPVDPRPDQHLGQFRPDADRLRRPGDAPGLLHRNARDRPAHLLSDPSAQDVLTSAPAAPLNGRSTTAAEVPLPSAAPFFLTTPHGSRLAACEPFSVQA